jgi:hypothetical protein
MWITINIDDIEFSLQDFLKRLPSPEGFSETIRDIENIDENWNRIHIHIVKDPKKKVEDDVIFRQI